MILFGALAARTLVAWFSPNIHHADEVFQYLEQAHRVVFGYGIVPWEYRDGIRSWILPGFIAGVIWGATRIIDEPWFYIGAAHLVLSVLSLVAVWVGFQWGERRGGLRGAVLTGVLVAAWFECVYFGSKTLTEAVAAHLLPLGIWLVWPAEPTDSGKRLFWGGVVLGFVVLMRLHLTPAVGVAALWAARSHLRTRWLPMFAGGALMIAAGGVLDAFTWSYPFQSLYRNVYINVIEDRASGFGVHPWYWYFGAIVKNWNAALVVLAPLCLAGLRRDSVLAAVSAAIVLPHMLVGHKEYRFIYPAVPLVLILAGVGATQVMAYLESRAPRIGRRRAVVTLFVACSFILISITIGVFGRFHWHWGHQGTLIAALYELRSYDDVKGIGYVNMPWWWTGGYTYLHRDVPIYSLHTERHDVEGLAPAFNYMLTTSEPSQIPSHFERLASWPYSDGERIRLYRREGAVVPSEERRLDRLIARFEAGKNNDATTQD